MRGGDDTSGTAAGKRQFKVWPGFLRMTEGDNMAQRIVFRAEFFREGDLYVGLASELNVSSFGETLDEAKRSLKEAVDGFLEECEAMGTLEEVIGVRRLCQY